MTEDISDAPAEEQALRADLELAAYKAILEAYYPDAVRTAALARDRARGGYAVVSALSAAAVAFFTGTQLDSRPLAVQAAGCLAVFAWLLATAHFLLAVSSATLPELDSQTIRSHEALARVILDRAKADARAVETHIRSAIRVAYAALFLSAITFTLYALVPTDGGGERIGVVLVDDHSRSPSDLCATKAKLRGEIMRSDDANYGLQGIRLRPDAGATVFVPAARISAVCEGSG